MMFLWGVAAFVFVFVLLRLVGVWAAALLAVISAVIFGGPARLLFIVLAVVFLARLAWIGRRRFQVEQATRQAMKTADAEQRAVASRVQRGWADAMHHAGLTVVDNRRPGLGWRRALSERHREMEAARALAEGTEARTHTPELAWIEPTASGLHVTAWFAPGNKVADWERACAALAPLWKVPAVTVAGVDGDMITLEARLRDPLAEPVTYDLSLPATLERVPFAITEDGSLTSVKVLESNILFGGEPGAGKSGGQTALLAGLARVPHVALVGLDPKRVELSPWRERFTRIAVRPDDATEVLRALDVEMERRYDYLELHMKKKFEPDEFSDDMPLIALVVDELAQLLTGGLTREAKDADKERATLILKLVQLGRAAGMFVSAATQKPDSTTVPTALRDLVQQRIGYRTGTRDMTETIMGRGRSEEAPAHQIALDAKGVAYALAEGQAKPTKIRTLWLPDSEIQRIAHETAHLRPSWQPDETPMADDAETDES